MLLAQEIAASVHRRLPPVGIGCVFWTGQGRRRRWSDGNFMGRYLAQVMAGVRVSLARLRR